MKTNMIVLAGLLFAAALPMLAHHSFAAEYDRNKQFEVKGTVTKVEWMNPAQQLAQGRQGRTGGRATATSASKIATFARQPRFVDPLLQRERQPHAV